jgi:hypothetical protein
MFRKILDGIARALHWIAAVLTQVGGAANGGRAADPSARALYEEKKEYRP